MFEHKNLKSLKTEVNKQIGAEFTKNDTQKLVKNSELPNGVGLGGFI